MHKQEPQETSSAKPDTRSVTPEFKVQVVPKTCQAFVSPKNIFLDSSHILLLRRTQKRKGACFSDIEIRLLTTVLEHFPATSPSWISRYFLTPALRRRRRVMQASNLVLPRRPVRRPTRASMQTGALPHMLLPPLLLDQTTRLLTERMCSNILRLVPLLQMAFLTCITDIRHRHHL